MGAEIDAGGFEPETFHHEVTRWTVGQLRAALEGLTDDAPIEVEVEEHPDEGEINVHVVTGATHAAGIPQVAGAVTTTGPWGLILRCQWPTGDYYRRRRGSPVLGG